MSQVLSMPSTAARLPVALVVVLTALAAWPAAHAAGAKAAGRSAVPPGGAVRMTPESRGKGAGRRYVARVDVVAPDGTTRRLPTVGGAGLFPTPSLAPDGRRFAFVREDGRIAVVSVADGSVLVLTPPDLPSVRGVLTRDDRDGAWVAGTGLATVRWSRSGASLLVQRLLQRQPAKTGIGLSAARSVSCTVRPARCSTAGAGAATDLLALPGGLVLRLDGPVSDGSDDGATTYGDFDRRQQRTILRRARRTVRTSAAVVGADRRVRARRVVRGTGRTGVVSFAAAAFPGADGTLVRRASTRVGPDRSDVPDGRSVDVATRTLRPWLVTPRGRIVTFPRRLSVDPIGALPDGRWLMPTRAVGPPSSSDDPEPELATLDVRGRVRRLRIGGRPVTPVRLALEAGLPDAFAVGADLERVTERAGDLVVVLRNTGAGGVFFFPADRALVRIPLDGSSPAHTIDHRAGASYAVR